MSNRRDLWLSIGDLSRRTGVGIEAIRYYERVGLLPRPPRTQAGHRAYGPDNLQTLTFIKHARELGFSLNDIRALLTLRGEDRRCMDVKRIASRHLDGVRTKLRHLADLERALAEAIERCHKGHPADCSVLEILETGPRPRAALRTDSLERTSARSR